MTIIVVDTTVDDRKIIRRKPLARWHFRRRISHKITEYTLGREHTSVEPH